MRLGWFLSAIVWFIIISLTLIVGLTIAGLYSEAMQRAPAIAPEAGVLARHAIKGMRAGISLGVPFVVLPGKTVPARTRP